MSIPKRERKTKEKVNVEVFQGWDGMKTIFDDMLEECKQNDTNYVFGASVGESTEKADIFFLKYSRARERKGIQTWILFNEDLRKRTERISFFKKSKKYHIKFLQQTTPAEIMLYKDKTNIIILTETPLVIRITNKEVMESFKQYFDIMWKVAKK